VECKNEAWGVKGRNRLSAGSAKPDQTGPGAKRRAGGAAQKKGSERKRADQKGTRPRKKGKGKGIKGQRPTGTGPTAVQGKPTDKPASKTNRCLRIKNELDIHAPLEEKRRPEQGRGKVKGRSRLERGLPKRRVGRGDP